MGKGDKLRIIPATAELIFAGILPCPFYGLAEQRFFDPWLRNLYIS